MVEGDENVQQAMRKGGGGGEPSVFCIEGAIDYRQEAGSLNRSEDFNNEVYPILTPRLCINYLKRCVVSAMRSSHFDLNAQLMEAVRKLRSFLDQITQDQ